MSWVEKKVQSSIFVEFEKWAKHIQKDLQQISKEISKYFYLR